MTPRKFLFVSMDSSCTDVAWQVKKEGNEVKLFIEDPEYRESADGFVDKTNNWKKQVNWADVVVFDQVHGFGKEAQQLREKGVKAVGGTPYTDKLEEDREFGQAEMKARGISIPPFRPFTDFLEAIEYVKDNPGRYVLKPSGKAQTVKHLLYVGEDEKGQDMVRILQAYQKVFGDKIKELVLQKRIFGVEVGVSAFFNGQQFIHPINVNFEHKKLFPGNLGPSTGEMGTSMFWAPPTKLFNATLQRFEPKLREEGYVGVIDINCVVNSYGIYPLEFTCRFGYPTISIQQEGLITPMGELLYGLASGGDVKVKTKTGFQVGVNIVVPPFPYEDRASYEAYSKDAVIVFRKSDYSGVHIQDVKMIDGEWVVAGLSGEVLIITGSGSTMRQAQQQAYSRVHNIRIPNMFYRTDIGDRWLEDTDKLHNWGYLREA